MTENWMIYGANGYTGELIAREATTRGLRPVLAGRKGERIHALAQELGCEARVFGLDDADAVEEQLGGCQLVLNCAGPFSATAAPMMEACLAVGAHYLDITGEIDVFEHAQSQSARAREAGVVLCPGVGFDVIPTDCVAAALKTALPDATEMALGFDSRTGMSPGTAKTTVEGMASGGMVRRGGAIVTVPLAYKTRHIDFGDGEKLAMTIAWGDVSTAYYTTGVLDITVYIPSTRGMVLWSKLADTFHGVLRCKWVQRKLKAYIEKTITGPGESTRARQPTFVWGEVRNAHGEVKTARVRTDNAYSLTVSGALAMVAFLRQNECPAGTTTPAQMIGPELVSQLPGSGLIEIS